MLKNARDSLGEIGIYWQTTNNGKNSGISSVADTGEDGAFIYYVRRVLKKDFGLIVFDIGAAVGEWTKVANRTLTNSNIYSFEPGVDYHNILKMRCVPSGGNDIVFERCAISSTTKNALFYTPKQGRLSHSSLLRENLEKLRGYEIDEHEVQCISIKDYLKNKNISEIDYLKLDTEGTEFEIVSSVVEAVDYNIGAIQFEYNDTYLNSGIRMQDFWRISQEKYYMFRICRSGLIYFKEYDPNYMEDMGMQNYILVDKNICIMSEVMRDIKELDNIFLYKY